MDIHALAAAFASRAARAEAQANDALDELETLLDSGAGTPWTAARQAELMAAVERHLGTYRRAAAQSAYAADGLLVVGDDDLVDVDFMRQFGPAIVEARAAGTFHIDDTLGSSPGPDEPADTDTDPDADAYSDPEDDDGYA